MDRPKSPFATFLWPVVCTRCGKTKQDVDGRSLYVSHKWLTGKRMVCPECFELEGIAEGLEKLTSWDDEDEVPF